MNAAPAFQVYAADELAVFSSLSVTEFGAYIILRLHEWQAGGVMSREHRHLARLCRMSLPEFEAVWPAIEALFVVVDEHGNYRSIANDRQREQQAGRRKQTSEAARRRWSQDGDANAMRTQCVRIATHCSSSSSPSVTLDPAFIRARGVKLLRSVTVSFPRFSSRVPPASVAEGLVADLLVRFNANEASAFAIVAELDAAFDGMHGPEMAADELWRNVGDFLANDEPGRPSKKRLRGYLYRKDPDRSATGQQRPGAPARGANAGQEMFNVIGRALTSEDIVS